MLFALAKTQGGRPETITTAAMSNDSPRTSAFPAPSLFPHCEPSTSQGIGATSPDASTGPNADNHTAGASQITFEDYDDVSSDDDYHMSGSTFTMALGHYFFERNLIETPKYYLVSKAVIEYVNLKFIENNFRTLGLDEMFDKDNIMKAEMEFESFEVWFSRLKECAIYRDYICDLRLPLFCHLYLNLYVPRNHARLQAFLRTFKYLFSSDHGAIYLEELRNVTDMLNLSPRLAYFRRNKFVYGVSPMFINDLYDFFQFNYMLQVVFQEWIDINYITHENPKIVLEEYYSNNLERENNLNKANAPKINDKNDNVNSFGTVLCKKTLNSSQKKNNNCKVNNSENDYYDKQRPSTSKDFDGSSSGSSYQVPNSKKLANNRVKDQQKRDTNSKLDESTENSEQSSTEDHSLEPRSRRPKKSTENSEQSSTEEDQYPETRSRRSKKLTGNSEQSSTVDKCPEPRSRRSKKLTDNSKQSSTVKKCPEPRSRRSMKSTENSEQSSTEDQYPETRSRRLKKSTENSEQSSSEDQYPETRSRRLKKKNIKRKHIMRRDRDRSSSDEQESNRLKKFCVEKYDDTSFQKRSISHEENEKMSESLRGVQSLSNQEEVKEERIILRLSRKANRLHFISSHEKKEPNDPENPILEKSIEEQIPNERKKCRKHQKKHKLRCKKNSSSNNNLHESSNETSNNDKLLRKKIKSSDRRKTTSDQNSRSCEKLSEISDDDDKEKKFKRQKKSSRKRSTYDDNYIQMCESLSEVSDEEKKKYERQMKTGKSKSISDDNIQMSGLSDMSNDDEKKQKRQNKRSKTKSTSDDNNCMSEDQECPNKDKEHHKSNARRKYERINISLSDSCSAGDSLEDSSSLYSSSYDEELSMRKFIRKVKKKNQHLHYETSSHLKQTKVTKIDLKNLDEDLYLRSSRKIILKNCSKLSCSILTFDQNMVVAGSIDSMIYLWERDNEQSVSEKSCDVLHTNENISPSNLSSSVQEDNLIEYLDKSKAFVLRGHSGSIFDLAEIPSAKILLSASNDKTYRAWDMATKQCIEVYNEHEHRTWCIAASPYSLQVATGSCEGASCLWFLNYKRPLRMFTGHLDDILVLKFHPNQVFLATGSSDKTVRVFELTTGDCHRVLTGHSDYITCLEFNVDNFDCLASASGRGEIIVWNVPSGEMVWKIRVGNMLFSNLVWLTKDVLLASLTSGVVLKCDTTLNYIDSRCKVNGYETPFYRLISLQMIDNIVYTIGIPDKAGGLKSLSKGNKEIASQMKNEQKSQKEPSPLSKLFFPQHILNNNGNSMTPSRRLSSTTPIPTFNFQYQINTNDQFNNSSLPNFLSLDLKSAPFNLSADEISKLSSEYQSKNIRLIPAVDITNNLKNAYLLPAQQNVRASNANSINAHSTNVQLPSTSKAQKLNKTQAPPKSKKTTAKQHNFGNSSLTMHTSIQPMQIKTNTVPEKLHLDDHKETNMLVQQYLQTTSTSSHKQQTSNLLQVTRSGMTSPLLQNSIVQQEQKMQLQHSIGNNSNVTGTNVQQQQLLQQSRSNTNLKKGNVQQCLSSQKNNRSSNATKRASPRQSPNKSSLNDTGTGKHTRMQ